MTIRQSACLVIVLCLGGAGGCSVRRPKVPEPVSPRPVPAPEAAPSGGAATGLASQEDLPPPPQLEPAPVGAALPSFLAGEKIPPPPAAPRERAPGAGSTAAGRSPGAAPGGDGAPDAVLPSEAADSGTDAVVVPKLTTVLSEKERWEHNQEIDRNLARVNDLLGELDPGRLSAEQHTALDRIRAIVRQTAETRSTDLAAARNLAQRAALLADDLRRTAR